MRAFIAVGCVDTRTDQRMTQVEVADSDRAVRGIHNIHIDSIADVVLLCQLNQLAVDVVVIRTRTVSRADGNLALGAGKTVADTAHVDTEDFRNARRTDTCRAVTDFFVRGEMDVDMTVSLDSVVNEILGKAEQDCRGELVIEIAGRKCLACELNPVYCDAIVKRWEHETGERAIRESDGLAFDDLIA